MSNLEEIIKKPVLRPDLLNQTANYSREHRFVEVPNHITMDDLMRPGFWSNYSRQLRRRELVEVVREDDTLDVTLRVLKVEPGMVHMRVHTASQLPDSGADAVHSIAAPKSEPQPMPDPPPGYKFGYVPAHKHYAKWGDEFVVSGQPTKQAAILGAIEHAKRAGNPLTAAA